MEIEVRFRDLKASEALRHHTVRRLEMALDRFADELTRVVVRLSDVNGPKGGVDKRCHLTLKGPRVGVLTVHQLSAEVTSAVGMACGIACRMVGREVEMLRRRHLTRLVRRSGA